MHALAEHIAILAADTRLLRRELLIGLPPDAAGWRPAPGLPSLGWHVVHAAYVRAAVLVLGDGGPDAGIARWRPLCHVGCPLAADGAFGALADALAEAERLEALATDRVAGWDDGLAAQPLPAADPELLQDPAHDRRAAALTMAAHDAYHLGQVALIRRLRGVPPLE